MSETTDDQAYAVASPVSQGDGGVPLLEAAFVKQVANLSDDATHESRVARAKKCF